VNGQHRRAENRSRNAVKFTFGSGRNLILPWSYLGAGRPTRDLAQRVAQPQQSRYMEPTGFQAIARRPKIELKLELLPGQS
jgi:hypothetical protein